MDFTVNDLATLELYTQSQNQIVFIDFKDVQKLLQREWSGYPTVV
jgi:hypothetical protein